MKKSILIIFLAVGFFGNNVYAQSLKDNQWSFQTRFGNRSALFSLVHNLLWGIGSKVCDSEGSEFWNKNSWWIPISNYYIDVPVSMTTPEGKVEFAHGNFWQRYLWGFNNYSVGFEVTWQQVRSPIGLFLDCDYKHYEIEMKFHNEESFNKYTTQSIVPAMGVRCKFGGFEKKKNLIIELGAAYNYNLSFKGKYDNSTNIVNNGIIGIYGIGYEIPATRGAISLRYQMNHYNYFNENFTPDNGATYPYQGVKSTIGSFNLSFSKRF